MAETLRELAAALSPGSGCEITAKTAGAAGLSSELGGLLFLFGKEP